MKGQDYENLRKSFQPDTVRVLLVGESRPQNGMFFYIGDSRLAKYTFEAFSIEYGRFQDIKSFLIAFKYLGCYLVDLCTDPVNGLPPDARKVACVNGEDPLSLTISELAPRAIIVVKKSIEQSVNRALNRTILNCIPKFILPFPAQGHECEYVQRLADAISILRSEGVLPSHI